jgi:hypothetical protein
MGRGPADSAAVGFLQPDDESESKLKSEVRAALALDWRLAECETNMTI